MADIQFNLEETEKFASAARDAINARLKLLPKGVLADYWQIVAKGYGTTTPPEAEIAPPEQ